MTTQEILNLTDSQIVNISVKIGKLGKSTQMQILRNTSRLTDETFYYVVTREGFLNYTGNALIAIYEGKENVDYKKFSNAEHTSKYITTKINK
jgi:hypothetical protein